MSDKGPIAYREFGNFPRVIGFSGLDGVGKSAIVKKLAESLKDRGISTRITWLRMHHYLSIPLLIYARYRGLTKSVYKKNKRYSFHEFYRSNFVAKAYVLMRSIDTFLAGIVLVRLPLIRNSKEVLVMDRNILDVLVDLQVDTHINVCKEEHWAHRLLKRVMPSDSVYIVIDRPLDKLGNIRPEIAYDRQTETRHKLYCKLAERGYAKLLNNHGTLADAMSATEDLVGELIG